MIARVLFIWLPFSVVLLLLALYSQDESFELQHALWALLLSLPVAVAVLRGGLGDVRSSELQYPSIALMIVSAWILNVGPSLVVESQDALHVYHYSENARALARVFFFGWCLLFSLLAGKSRPLGLHVKTNMLDFVLFMAFAVLLAGYLVRVGAFSAYQATKDRTALTAGSTVSIATVISLPLFTQLPALSFLHLRGRSSSGSLLLVLAGFIGSWIVLFLLGSRTSVAVAVAECLLLARQLGLRLRANVVIGLAVAVPTVLTLILVYRSALASTGTLATTVSQYLSIASDATTSLNEQAAQSQALDLVKSNARIRLWYGQVFSVLIDDWLHEGAAVRGSLFAGVIASIPTAIMPEKNSLAVELDFERLLHKTQHYPDVDLSPMPWMQWLYELGILGLLLGALLYAWLVNVIESRIGATRSFYEVFIWLQLFSAMLPAEHTTDVLMLMLRNALVVALLIGGLARLLSWATMLGRDPHAAH